MTTDANLTPSIRVGITRFVRRGSARLAYEPGGGTENGARTVVLLHDLLEDRSAFSDWRPLFAAVDDASPWRLILPDTRGHGASATPGNQRLSLDDLAADLLAILDAEATDHAHLVGKGLGGAIALTLARLAPDRVGSLVMLAPAIPAVLASDPDPTVRAAAAAVRDRWRTVSDHAIRGQTDQALDLLLSAERGSDWRERLPGPRQAAIRRHAGALGALLAALAAAEPAMDDLAAIRRPTLIIQHNDADPLDAWIASYLVAALPDARLEMIAAVPDLVDDRLAEVVRRFLTLVDPE